MSVKIKLNLARFVSFAYFLGFFIILATGIWLVENRYEAAHPVRGQISASIPASDNYKQLDLSLAAKAYYTNKPVNKKRVIDVGSAFQNIVFSFAVPKDGLTEYGLMSLPTASPPSQGYPVIILCHGYANPWNYSTYYDYLGDMEFYASHGFAVLKPDFRGQGLSVADGTPDGAFYSMSYNTDIMSLIAAIKQTPYLDKTDINLWGHSMGAYIALRAAVLSPSIKNVILLSGPTGTAAELYYHGERVSDRLNPTAGAIRADELARFGTPVSNPAFWNKTSPLNYLSKSKAHFQIHVGSADKIVPPSFSDELNQALDKAGVAHDYYIYQGAQHGLVPQRPLIWSRSLALLQTKN